MNDYVCRVAASDEVKKRWEKLVMRNPHDAAWKEWAVKFEEGVKRGGRICFYGFLRGTVIAEATAAVKCGELKYPEGLVDDKTAYLMAFRTDKEYRGKGYFSKLYRFAEKYLADMGFSRLTIGVEDGDIINSERYKKWGFAEYVKCVTEFDPPAKEGAEPQKVVIKYYAKNL